MNRILLAAVLAVFVLIPGLASAGDADGATSSIESIFDHLVSEGVLKGKLKASPIKQVPAPGIRLFIQNSADEFFRLPDRALVFPVKVPLLSSRTNAVPAMTEVNNMVAQVCQDAGGELEFLNSFMPRGSIKEYLVADFNDLRALKLVGDFDCRSPEGTLFQVEIWPSITSDPQLFSLQWNIYAYLIGRDKFAEIEKKVSVETAKDSALMNNLKPGDKVAVPAYLIPGSLLKDVQDASTVARATGSDQFRICSLVIDVKPDLVQVQVGAGTIYIPTKNLTPLKKKIKIDEGIPIGNWSNWCI